MSTPYCTADDLEAIWAPDLLLASVDDDESGTLSPAEAAHIDRAIERAAGRMNAYLELRYPLTSLSGNAWCRDANAAIAVYLLAIRRGEAAPAVLQEQYDAYLGELLEIAAARRNVCSQVVVNSELSKERPSSCSECRAVFSPSKFALARFRTFSKTCSSLLGEDGHRSMAGNRQSRAGRDIGIARINRVVQQAQAPYANQCRTLDCTVGRRLLLVARRKPLP